MLQPTEPLLVLCKGAVIFLTALAWLGGLLLALLKLIVLRQRQKAAIALTGPPNTQPPPPHHFLFSGLDIPVCCSPCCTVPLTSRTAACTTPPRRTVGGHQLCISVHVQNHVSVAALQGQIYAVIATGGSCACLVLPVPRGGAFFTLMSDWPVPRC